MGKKAVFVIIVIVIVVAAIVLFWQKSAEVPTTKETPRATLGGSIYEQIEEQGSPLKKLPETNLFTAETNPFKGGYKNPFGQ